MLLLAIIIVAFFFFFGCPYEIINFYLSPSEDEEKPVRNRRNGPKERRRQVRSEHRQNYEKAEKTENNPTTQELGQTGRCQNNNDLEVENNRKKGVIELGKWKQQHHNDDAIEIIAEPASDESEKKEINLKTIIICIFLGLLGLALQPFYLLFYIFVGVMECYRRFACWYFYF